MKKGLMIMVLLNAAVLNAADQERKRTAAPSAGPMAAIREKEKRKSLPAEEQATLNKQLLSAVSKNDASLVRTLIAQGADANMKLPSMKGKTLLMMQLSKKKRREDVIDALLTGGIDWSMTDKQGASLDIYADYDQYPDLIEKFIVQGGRIFTLFKALDDIAGSSYEKEEGVPFPIYIMRLVIEKNPSAINEAQDAQGNTPLMKWIPSNLTTYPLIVELLNYNPDLDKQNVEGDTALSMAVKLDADHAANKTEIITLLLNKGANPFIRNKQGKTAADLARQQGGSIAALFEPYEKEKKQIHAAARTAVPGYDATGAEIHDKPVYIPTVPGIRTIVGEYLVGEEEARAVSSQEEEGEETENATAGPGSSLGLGGEGV